jgi:hypothetical protein
MRIYSLALVLFPLAHAQTSSKCADLTKFKIPGVPIVITKAITIPTSSAPGTPTAETSATSATIPSHCQADGMINERTGPDGKTYGIGFSLALPDNWKYALDNFDLLTATVNWVEKGTAPNFVLATEKAFPGRSRPLCAYPKYAHYKGQGDPEDARNFECRE